MDKLSILLLDDGRQAAPLALDQVLREGPWAARRAQNAEEAAAHLEQTCYHLLLVHAASCRPWLPFLQQLAAGANSPPVLVIAPEPRVEEAVEAVRAGAFDYVEANLTSDRLRSLMERAIATGETAPAAVPALERPRLFPNIIGNSGKIQKVFSLIEKICDTDTTVLIQGESGTGKELIAQALHYQGARRHGPFIPVNCGAIPGELLESELFGHEKGAFTHAIRTRIGRFELAHGGTVFLDEISEMNPMLQVKILRVLQERQFERIGGTKTIKSDFRVIAATNRNLEEEVQQGNFREDLFYRLNVIPIEAPPLRERITDIPPLVQHFIAKYNNSKRKLISGLSPEALSCLTNYHWPGNVRELENVIERMVILATGEELSLEDLPRRIRENGGSGGSTTVELPGDGFVLSEAVADFEKKLIIQALNRTNWVKNQAAKLLNVNRTTLLEKMKRYSLINPSPDLS